MGLGLNMRTLALLVVALTAQRALAVPAVVATLDVEPASWDGGSGDIGPGDALPLSLAIVENGGGTSLEHAAGRLGTPWLTEADVGLPWSFTRADVEAFVAVLTDEFNGTVFTVRDVGGPMGYTQTGTAFPDYLPGGLPRNDLLESEVFGAPNLANLLDRSTIERVDFELTNWGTSGRQWAGTFTFYTPEPSTALLLGLGLAWPVASEMPRS